MLYKFHCKELFVGIMTVVTSLSLPEETCFKVSAVGQ